jgi:acyl-CoA synthetase (AMP-forming)/AMP-acid ligase II
MVFLGIIASGGIFTGTNPSYTEFELVHHIKTSKTKFLITEPGMLQGVLKAAKACGIPQSNVWIFDVLGQAIPAGFKSFRDLMNHGEIDWIRFDNEKMCKETTAARLFSSGTTGLPKAVVVSHHNLISQHTLAQEVEQKPYKVTAKTSMATLHRRLWLTFSIS